MRRFGVPYSIYLVMIMNTVYALARQPVSYHTVRIIGYQAGVNAEWITKYWPVNALNDTALAEKALAETLDAHLIVIPWHCA